MSRTIVVFIMVVILLCGCANSSQKGDVMETIVKEATVTGTVTDETGRALISQVIIKSENFFQRINTDVLGRYTINLPLDSYAFEITKGSEYERKTLQVDVIDRTPKYIEAVRLKKLYETGWIAGDLHQHSNYSIDAANTTSEILMSDLSMGLKFGVITDHNDIRANSEFLNASLEGFIPFAGIEITTGRGHYNAINFSEVVDTSVDQGAKDIQRIIDQVNHQPGAILQVNHPVRNDDFAFKDWELVGQFDILELWNGKSMPPCVEGEPNYLGLQKWYELLNQGIYVPASAGSDNHNVQGNKVFQSQSYKSEYERYLLTSMFSGMPRLYVLPATYDQAGVLKAITQGNSFLTNNPLAYLTIDGAIPGQQVNQGEHHIEVLAQSNRPLTKIRIVNRGEVLHESTTTDLVCQMAMDDVYLNQNDWIVLEVFGENGDYAITNPVFIK